MMRNRASRLVRPAVAAMAAAAIVAGCSSTGAGGGSSADPVAGPSSALGLIGVEGDPGEPIRGGTLTFSTHAQAVNLDPAKTAARGESGGSELAAVYDVLMRYDSAANEFVPQLARSLDVSSDQLTWTLSLRDGVTFSDGGALDADAVVWSINRYNEGRGNGAAVWTTSVVEMTAPDPTTVEFKLNHPWPSFPSMLALGHGMIVSPTSGQGEAFTPIGACPYILDRYLPNEERVLNANPDYWNGVPYLDKLRFVALNGPQQNVDTLKAGGIEMAFLRGNPQAIAEAKSQYPGYMNVLNSGGAELINNREGRPGADARVRQAIAHAIDPVLVDERADAGLGLPTSALFGPESRWSTDIPGPSYDPDKARQLLDAAKADGYDGHLDYVVLQEPRASSLGLAVQSMLQAVGFEVTIVPANSAGDIVSKVYVEHNFDLAHAGIGLYESIPFLGLETAVHSKSSGNFSGYANPEMDALLNELQQASDEDSTREVLDKIQALWNDTVPSASISGIPIYVTWQQTVHGVRPTATNIMLLDKAWISK